MRKYWACKCKHEIAPGVWVNTYRKAITEEEQSEDVGRCIAVIRPRSSMLVPFAWQCSKKRGYGPDGLYCKLHAKMIERGDKVEVPPDE